MVITGTDTLLTSVVSFATVTLSSIWPILAIAGAGLAFAIARRVKGFVRL